MSAWIDDQSAGSGLELEREEYSITLIVMIFSILRRISAGESDGFVNRASIGPLLQVPALRLSPLCLSRVIAVGRLEWYDGTRRQGERRYFKSINEEIRNMSKLLSILVAAVFAVSTGTVLAAAHAKAAPAGEKKEEMKKDAKAEVKKDEKAAKKEVKDEKKAAKKEVKEEKKEAKKEVKEEMKAEKKEAAKK